MLVEVGVGEREPALAHAEHVAAVRAAARHDRAVAALAELDLGGEHEGPRAGRRRHVRVPARQRRVQHVPVAHRRAAAGVRRAEQLAEPTVVERQHAVALGLGPPQRDQLAQPLRMRGGEVDRLGRVGVSVVELPGLGVVVRARLVEAHRLPAVVPDSAVPEHIEVLRALSGRHPGRVLHARRPVHDERIAHAAGVGVLLVALERRVAAHRPAPRVVGVAVGGADRVEPPDRAVDVLLQAVEVEHLVEHAGAPALLARAVVAHRDEQRVVELPHVAQRVDEAAERRVGVLEERGERLHPAVERCIGHGVSSFVSCGRGRPSCAGSPRGAQRAAAVAPTVARAKRPTLTAVRISSAWNTAMPIQTPAAWPWSISQPKPSGAIAMPASSPE